MGRLDGKVAFITGGAMGPGPVARGPMAEEGADIIALISAASMDSVEYPLATPEDLEDTVRLVEKAGGRIFAQQARRVRLRRGGVGPASRDRRAGPPGLRPGERRDNAHPSATTGSSTTPSTRPSASCSTGVFHTCEAAIPQLIEQDQGGAIVITSSTAGLKDLGGPSRASSGYLGYTASKHGVVGLMRAYANSLAPYRIRCNTVHPTGVNSPMVVNQDFARSMQDIPAEAAGRLTNPLPVELIDVSDVSRAIIFLCSDDARYVTGVTFPRSTPECATSS